MANFTAKDAAGSSKTYRSVEDGSAVHTPGKTLYKTDGSTAYQAVEEATFTGRVGEVQASPTANTLLGRLKDLLSLTILAAGENIIGKVGRPITVVSKTPTVQAAAYADGDLVGGKIDWVNAARVSGGGGRITSAIITDLAAQSAAFDVILFDSDPAATTFTENSPLDVADADLVKIIGVFRVATTDYSAFVDNSAAMKAPGDLLFKLASGTTLYGALILRGSTPTYVGTTDITARLAIEQS
jgi:hypothetical protein